MSGISCLGALTVEFSTTLRHAAQGCVCSLEFEWGGMSTVPPTSHPAFCVLMFMDGIGRSSTKQFLKELQEAT